eukprot:TRINITY_DN14586_c0_g1_i1.p1 TRINITY_DN14586_c0_g1~~TRINITY_DN14586_c0_g1_i1.p1  ORF type:complete len:679 (+),score=173.25 TRINITY_DN14586_c0_g1_i1:58-2094(+)
MSANRFAVLMEDGSSDEEASPASPMESKPTVLAAPPPRVAQHEGGMLYSRSTPQFQWGTTQPVDLGFSPEDLQATLRVLKALGDNMELFKLQPLKPLRGALHPFIAEQMKNYEIPKDYELGRKRKRKKDGVDVDNVKRMEKRYINRTQLRAIRMQRLEEMNAEGTEPMLRILDGVAETAATAHTTTRMITGPGTDQLQLPAVEPSAAAPADDLDGPGSVKNPIVCYICKAPFTALHFFYDQLCPECASFNYKKRTELCDLRGKVCLVTGARVKIGYRCALKLLRCGALVVCTTRFPHDAAQRFAKEADFASWKERLHIHGLDFRDLATLEAFCTFFIAKYPRLDVLINNACQTVRRPPAYYQHLLSDERVRGVADNVEPEVRGLLEHHFAAQQSIHQGAPSSVPRIAAPSAGDSTQNATGSGGRSGVTIEALDETDEDVQAIRAAPTANAAAAPATDSVHAVVRNSDASPRNAASSVEMSQMQLLPEDANYSTALFPTGATDVNNQQVDLRTHNSWMLRLHEVSTPELAEVLAINTMAPFILNSRLKPLMERDLAAHKFVVNVSAMEGKFYRFKSENHPHTNMAKAALNMMTRTSAVDYKRSNIYMTAVDTGWINDEKPLEKAVNHMQTHGFQTPLDEIDAAARVLDPVIAPLLALQQGELFDPPWGYFLKDFMKCEW